jgi:hypothetical protein
MYERERERENIRNVSRFWLKMWLSKSLIGSGHYSLALCCSCVPQDPPHIVG